MDREVCVLLSAMCTTYTQSIDQEISKRINPHFLKVLEFIRTHENCICKDLSKTFTMSKSNVTKIVDYLVKKELVIRHEGREDRRIIHLSVTEQGYDVCVTSEQVLLHYAQLMSEAFQQEDRHVFCEKLTLAIRKMNEESNVVVEEALDYHRTHSAN